MSWRPVGLSSVSNVSGVVFLRLCCLTRTLLQDWPPAPMLIASHCPQSPSWNGHCRVLARARPARCRLDAVVQRREQTFLRDFLFGSNEEGTCAICGSVLPTTLLVAAHIKPRSECTDSERRDFVNNIVPICLIGCDALFERGLIVVKGGQLRVRIRASADHRLKALCRHLNGRRINAWKAGRIPYFRWHASGS